MAAKRSYTQLDIPSMIPGMIDSHKKYLKNRRDILIYECWCKGIDLLRLYGILYVLVCQKFPLYRLYAGLHNGFKNRINSILQDEESIHANLFSIITVPEYMTDRDLQIINDHYEFSSWVVLQALDKEFGGRIGIKG